MITGDIGEHNESISVGDEVEMWGENIPVEEVAQCADTIPYELLCNVTPRVSYQYIKKLAALSLIIALIKFT